MYFKLSKSQEIDLLNQPETGMGYQVVEANKTGSYNREKFLILNSEVVIEMNGYEDGYIRKVINEGIFTIKSSASFITLNSITVLNEKQIRNQVNESKNEKEKGALDNPKEYANGEEIFVRLSAFDDDKRIDKINKCLRPGSFTTTEDDYIVCKYMDDDPIERYALPNNDEIKFAFYIQPIKSDTLQRGRVQPANGKRGGGKEAYFANGTAKGTFKNQTPYN
jgi:hypothetical protein